MLLFATGMLPTRAAPRELRLLLLLCLLLLCLLLLCLLRLLPARLLLMVAIAARH